MRRLLVSFLLVFFSFFVIFPNPTYAKVITAQKDLVEVNEDEVIDDDLFIAAGTIDIRGTINGDVYLAAETITVNGVVNGDLIVGAGSLYLSGKVKDDVYAGSGSVVINKAEIGDSLLVGTGNITIDQSSKIGGSFIAGSGSVNLNAPVGRNVMIGAGTINIDSSVGGEVRLGSDDITIGPNTNISKDLYYTNGDNNNNLKLSSSASISGAVKRVDGKFTDQKKFEEVKIAVSKAFKTLGAVVNIMSFFGALVVGYLALKFFPKVSKETANLVSVYFLNSLAKGLLISLLAIPILILLFITMVGAPLAGILLLILLIGIYLSKLVVALALGYWLKDKFDWKNMTEKQIFTVGLLAIYILKMIPIIGALTSLIILWTGLGALYKYSKASILKV